MSSKIRKAVLEAVKDLYDIGLIDDATMRRFKRGTIPPVREYSPEEIRALRERLKITPTTFAHYLHTSSSTVKKWEQGVSRPGGPALKLLNVVDHKGLEAIS